MTVTQLPIDRELPKCPTGIQGLDVITGGGLPRGRPTLVCGAAGCGKTLLATEFLVRGVTEQGEPGVFMAFEETAAELTANVRSLGFDLDELLARNQLAIDHVRVERSEIEETGEYDLEGLFIRLGYAIDRVKAKRVVLDTVETLFGGLSDAGVLRAELRRLFRWLKDKGVTAVITGERGNGTLTRHGLEEYVSDCVILLDHRVSDQLATRRLRIVKYRGTSHGTNEYPFLIDRDGIKVIPITSLSLHQRVTTERVPSGVAGLDDMLGGGFFRGSSVLVSGTAGTGKTSLSAHFADAVCRRGERCLYFAFEESQAQILRNVSSIGIQLHLWIEQGLLKIVAARPTAHGLEAHLAESHEAIRRFAPSAVIMDPVSSLRSNGPWTDVRAMLTRLMDYLKGELITSFFTSLSVGSEEPEETEVGISSIIDTWLLVRSVELNGERNRVLYILKSRGMAHSNQLREFRFTAHGIELVPAYLGPEGALTGSARLSQEARERAERVARDGEVDRLERELERKRQRLEAQMADLRRTFESERDELTQQLQQRRAAEEQGRADADRMATSRHAMPSADDVEGTATPATSAGDR